MCYKFVMLHQASDVTDDTRSIIVTSPEVGVVPQCRIFNVLIGSSLWQCVDCLGHAGPTVEQQLFSVDPSLVLIHQCLSLFQPVEAITGVGATKPGDLFEGFVYPASLLIFTLFYSFSVFFSLFPFFFHSFPFFLLFLHLVTFQV